ncbi:MAG: sulfatase-like hydrolase/transferase [Bacteroidales bacterium]|nr:sulfatase-like hydrolase/transferase [Bacteroidales bacterium]
MIDFRIPAMLLLIHSAASAQKPNIIVIISDDQSFNSINYAGGDVYTPSIDSLAGEGIKFSNAHIASTVCSPSRYSLLTGKFPGRCYGESFMSKFPEGTQTRVENNTELSKGEAHLGSILKENGYKTGFVGKSHIMDHAMLNIDNWTQYGLQTYSLTADPYDPVVDASMKHNHSVMQEIVKSYGFDYADGIYMSNVKELKNDALNVHNMEWTVDKALKFIEEEKDNPFFLYFSTTLHHGPVPWGIKDGEYWSSFDADPKLTGEGVVNTPWDFMPTRQEIQDKVVQAGYPENTAYSLLLDEGIKAIHKKVADLGLANNTLIIFMPDHGSWRHGKATLHDYGTKVPMFMYWKDSIVSGVDYPGLIQSIDFAPTILDIAGVEYEADTAFDGMSLKHILKTGEGSAHESLFAELGYARSVKTKKWKYISVRYPEDVQEKIDLGGTWTGFDGGILRFPYLTVNGHLGHYASIKNPHYFEMNHLYDLEADSAETVNLYEEYPDVVLQMKELLSGYLKDFENRPFGEFTRDANSAPCRAILPVPRTSANTVSFDEVVLEWTSEAGAESHDVYFGTSNPPPFIGNQEGNNYDPGTIQPGTRYYWRIDEINEYGTTTGLIWDFETGSDLGLGNKEGSTNELSWSIYPNPVSGNQVTFQNPGKNPATIYIHNSLGGLVKSIYAYKPMITLLTKDLSPGIYPVSIKAPDMSWKYNLVIN